MSIHKKILYLCCNKNYNANPTYDLSTMVDGNVSAMVELYRKYPYEEEPMYIDFDIPYKELNVKNKCIRIIGHKSFRCNMYNGYIGLFPLRLLDELYFMHSDPLHLFSGKQIVEYRSATIAMQYIVRISNKSSHATRMINTNVTLNDDDIMDILTSLVGSYKILYTLIAHPEVSNINELLDAVYEEFPILYYGLVADDWYHRSSMTLVQFNLLMRRYPEWLLMFTIGRTIYKDHESHLVSLYMRNNTVWYYDTNGELPPDICSNPFYYSYVLQYKNPLTCHIRDNFVYPKSFAMYNAVDPIYYDNNRRGYFFMRNDKEYRLKLTFHYNHRQRQIKDNCMLLAIFAAYLFPLKLSFDELDDEKQLKLLGLKNIEWPYE